MQETETDTFRLGVGGAIRVVMDYSDNKLPNETVSFYNLDSKGVEFEKALQQLEEGDELTDTVKKKSKSNVQTKTEIQYLPVYIIVPTLYPSTYNPYPWTTPFYCTNGNL